VKRDPRKDPRPGDCLGIGHIERVVLPAPASRVRFRVPRDGDAVREVSYGQWARSMRKATVYALGRPEVEPAPDVSTQGEMFEA
jgi:hypothetical protein